MDAQLDYKSLGEILKKARIDADYTQAQVAALLHVTPQNISSWERGKSKMDIENYIRLCHFYNIDLLSPIIDSSDSDRLLRFPILAEECEINSRTITVNQQEQDLVSDYRKLDEQGKEYIRHTMAITLRAHSEKNNAASYLETAN